MQVTKEEFLGWRSNPVTEEIWQVLRERREKVGEQLCRGACLDNSCEYAKAVGHCEEIKDLLDLTYEDMLPEGKVDV